MFTFITTATIILVMLVKKLYFFGLEDEYSKSVLGFLDILSVFVLLVVGSLSFFKKSHPKSPISRKRKVRRKFDILSLVLLVATVVVIGMTFQLNLRKISIHWDAIALYDARAVFLKDGLKFSEMPALSKYDDRNKYYYLLYPPYTSIGHFFWRNTSFLSRLPVSVYYSIFLTFLVTAIVLIGRQYLGQRAALLLALVVASNNSIFKIAIKEYTNLPFTLHIVAGTFLLFSYLKSRKMWELVFGVLMISTSVWIRLLEPIWLAVSLAFGAVLITRKHLLRNQWPFLLLITVGILQYVSWLYFAKSIGGNPGFLKINTTTIVEPFVGILTGAPLVVIFTVMRTWGLSLLIHFFAISALLLRYKYALENRAILFMGLVIVFSISLYMVEFYFLSFQYDWWSIVAMSLDRSSTFLIPLSGYILIHLIANSKLLLKKD